jgi:hypothetical protein
MWRRLLRHVHPDTGGEHELFVWCRALYEHVAGDYNIEDVRTTDERRHPPRHPTSSADPRLDFTRAYDLTCSSFDELTQRALRLADEVGEPYARLLRLLRDCVEAPETDVALHRQQHQGATYKTLAAIAYAAGFDKERRVGWYRIAERVPLAQRHAGHIISRLREGQ